MSRGGIREPRCRRVLVADKPGPFWEASKSETKIKNRTGEMNFGGLFGRTRWAAVCVRWAAFVLSDPIR